MEIEQFVTAHQTVFSRVRELYEIELRGISTRVDSYPLLHKIAQFIEDQQLRAVMCIVKAFSYRQPEFKIKIQVRTAAAAPPTRIAHLVWPRLPPQLKFWSPRSSDLDRIREYLHSLADGKGGVSDCAVRGPFVDASH